MSEIYSRLYSGDGNPAKRPGVGQKISNAKKGKVFSEDHKKALCKPKSKTHLIKEVANRPDECRRRSERMIANNPSSRPDVREKISRTISELMSSGDFQRSLDRGWITTPKTPFSIWCRSGLEKDFIQAATECEQVTRKSHWRKLTLVN
jgi:hypothetical protein